MSNYIERPVHRIIIQKVLEKNNCTLESLINKNISEKKRTQIKKMIWERDHKNGEVIFSKRYQNKKEIKHNGC